MQTKKIAIVGTAGVPANYGGFETLAENLVKYHQTFVCATSLTVYCSSSNYPYRKKTYLTADLKYIPLSANGAQSIFYDIYSLFSAVWSQNHVILLLGVSGALALPLIRLISSTHIIVNIDGIEWRRRKWSKLARWFLRLSEKIAVRFSHAIIADNSAIADYIRDIYSVDSHTIAYGGDHAINAIPLSIDEYNLPQEYALSICRIEPENNIRMLVEAFSQIPTQPLVLVGNWENSEYGRAIRAYFENYPHIFLLDPIYDLGKLHALRSQSTLYLHGHSAGGTNPSLIEAMHFGKVIMAFDCDFNRVSTENKALYFNSADQLIDLVQTINHNFEIAEKVKHDMLSIARTRYTWNKIADQYFTLIDSQYNHFRTIS